MTREQAQALADKLMRDSMLRQGSSADTILATFEGCSRTGFAAGLEAGAQMAEAEAKLNDQSIGCYTPCNVRGDGSREVRIGGRSVARHIATALRERAREEKAKP